MVGPGHSDYIYWSEIRGKCVLEGLYDAGWNWFSLAERQKYTGPMALKGDDEGRNRGWIVV